MTLQLEARRVTSALVAVLLAMSMMMVSRIHDTFDLALSSSMPDFNTSFRDFLTIGPSRPISLESQTVEETSRANERSRAGFFSRRPIEAEFDVTDPATEAPEEPSQPDNLSVLPELGVTHLILGALRGALGWSGKNAIQPHSRERGRAHRLDGPESLVVASSKGGGHDVSVDGSHKNSTREWNASSTSHLAQLEGLGSTGR